MTEPVDAPPVPISLDELKQQAEEEGKPSVASEEKPRRRRKKGRVDESPEAEVFDTPLPVIAGVAKSVFGAVALVRRCPVWRLDDDEANQLADGVKPAWDMYVAPYAGRYVILLSAFASVFQIVARKAALESEWKKKTESSSSSAERERESRPISAEPQKTLAG